MSHDHHHALPRTPVEERVDALEALMIEKGLLDAATIDAVVEYYEHAVGPMNGARVVARAWVDREYRARLLQDGTAAIGELGFGGPEGEHMVVVENTPQVHNAVVCTLCSCYPWPVLGLPPNWYKSAPYRSRMVREPACCWPRWVARFPTTSKCGSGTPRPRSATSCCRSVPRALMTSTRSSSPPSSAGTR